MNISSNRRVVSTVVPPGHTFTIDSRYQPGKMLGKGSFGVVCTAFDTVKQITVAIKRIRPFANDEWDARHTLREIRLMKLLGRHPNIITLYELSIFEEKSELYMVMELMDCDLHRIIQSKQPLNDMHYKCFAKQMLEGIRAMHEIGVFHRDLKPGNILVSKDCQLRITDFGLARFIDKVTLSGNNRQNPLTEYVVTRWYRCPELLLSPNLPYSAAIDIWSIGCIIGELIKRKPLFPGKSHANQVQLILEIRGYTDPSNFGFELTSEAASFLDRKCRYHGKSLSSFIPQATTDSLELLEMLLNLNPKYRPSATQALEFPYLQDAQVLCDYSSNIMPKKINEKYFDFERIEYSLGALQNMVREECERPCDDSVFFPNGYEGGGEGGGGGEGEEGEEDHGQQMKQRKLQRPYETDIYSTEHDENQIIGRQQGVRHPTQQQQQQLQKTSSSHSLKNTTTPSRKIIEHSDSSQTIPTTVVGGGSGVVVASGGGGGSEVGNKMTRSKSAPPSPSPQKMEMITKQEKKHKRRFFLQGLNKSSHEQSAQDQGMGGSGGGVGTVINSSRSDQLSSNEELTSRRDIVPPAGVIRAGVHHLTSGSLRSVSNKYIPNADQSSTQQLQQQQQQQQYSASEKLQKTPTLSQQFQNLSVSYGGLGGGHNNNQEHNNGANNNNNNSGNIGISSILPTRKLASAPPVETRITRLPALHPNKKTTFGSR